MFMYKRSFYVLTKTESRFSEQLNGSKFSSLKFDFFNAVKLLTVASASPHYFLYCTRSHFAPRGALCPS